MKKVKVTHQKLKNLDRIKDLKNIINSHETEYNSKINALYQQIEDLNKKKNQTISRFQTELEDLLSDKGNSQFQEKFDFLAKTLNLSNKNKEGLYQKLKYAVLEKSKFLYFNIYNPQHSVTDSGIHRYNENKNNFVRIDLTTFDIIKSRQEKIKEIIR